MRLGSGEGVLTSEFYQVVRKLESLQIMPKTMPGLEKIKSAMSRTKWADRIDANKVIVVAGTNGKGSTCAALEALLLAAGQRVGLYTSPHLVRTTERIRLNGVDISEENFVKLYEDLKDIIEQCQLSHFEALTLMMGHFFFSEEWGANPDFVILEVGLGGLYDATNAFPHKFNVITKLGYDHVNILGPTLEHIAFNKFGIVGKKSIVVYQKLAPELLNLKLQIQKETNSNWVEVPTPKYEVKSNLGSSSYFLEYEGRKFEINLPGKRGAENILTAITALEVLGFNPTEYLSSLNRIRWNGRMQKLSRPGFKCPVYLSGDHNRQGFVSLVEILNEMKYSELHLLVGVGSEKDAEGIYSEIKKLNSPFKLYLTKTPFKGRELNEYPKEMIENAAAADEDFHRMLNEISRRCKEDDLCVISGSLYLVGEVLKENVSI